MNIQDTEIIFADDAQALEQAYAAGAPRSAQVYSASPALLLQPGSKVRQYDKDLSPARMLELGADMRACSADLFKEVFDKTGVHGLAVAAARYVLTVQNQIYKATSLTEEIIAKRVLVTEVQTGNARRNHTINTPWRGFLPDDTQAETLAANVNVPPLENVSADAVAPFFTRLRFESLQSLGYRVAERLGAKAPWFPARGNIWVAHESSLLKETAFQLFKRGYRIQAIPKLAVDKTAAIDAALLASCRDIFADCLDKILIRPVSRAFLDECMTGFAQQLETCAAYITAWRQWLETAPKNVTPTMVLHGFPASPPHIGLLQVCHDKGIVTAGFQHGVAREISGNLINIESLYENSLVEHLFTYNDECATRSSENRLAFGRSISVGLSTDLAKSAGGIKRRPETPPILYPTTALYSCNVQLPGRACMTDMEKSRFEIRLVEDVFAALPHRVRYKPYIANRYIDPDPIRQAVEATASVEYYSAPVDLRYIAGESRVIVVSRATSTVAWCLMSHRPLVFIDCPDQPLSDQARAAFIDGFFYFDAQADDFFDALRDFLSQPLDVIEAHWRDKTAAREIFLARYIGDQSCRAGNRAADHLIQALKERRACVK
jgi:hypothetical protein